MNNFHVLSHRNRATAHPVQPILSSSYTFSLYPSRHWSSAIRFFFSPFRCVSECGHRVQRLHFNFPRLGSGMHTRMCGEWRCAHISAKAPTKWTIDVRLRLLCALFNTPSWRRIVFLCTIQHSRDSLEHLYRFGVNANVLRTPVDAIQAKRKREYNPFPKPFIGRMNVHRSVLCKCNCVRSSCKLLNSHSTAA